MSEAQSTNVPAEARFIRGLGLLDSTIIMLVLIAYKTQTTWPGLLIVLAGVPVYFLWRKRAVSLASSAGVAGEQQQ